MLKWRCIVGSTWLVYNADMSKAKYLILDGTNIDLYELHRSLSEVA